MNGFLKLCKKKKSGAGYNRVCCALYTHILRFGKHGHGNRFSGGILITVPITSCQKHIIIVL